MNGLKILIGFLLIGCTVCAQYKDANSPTVKASFTFDTQEYDYGTIPENGGIKDHNFIIKNTGKTPLVINQVVSSCGCTTVDWTREAIASGKTGFVKTSFNPKGRPAGVLDREITVNIESADPVKLKIKGQLVVGGESTAEKLPVLSLAETEHDFGTIGESDGYAEHIFTFKNTGEAPLVVNNVQASCGCTKPTWTTDPVAPGQDGVIIITYDPRGRMGNFNKTATVYTNEDNGFKRYKLTITGNVVEKPRDPVVSYVDTIGGVGIEQNNLNYKNFTSNQENRKAFYLKNYNTKTVYLTWDNLPEYTTVKSPDSLKGEWAGEANITIDGTKTTDKRGRVKDNIYLTVKDSTGKILGKETFTTTVNFLDEFKQLSPLESVNSPRLNIENTMIDFSISKNTTKEIILTNKGKSDLIIHSLTSDDSRVNLPQIKETLIAAGASLPVKATIKAKDIKTSDIDTDIYVVCNDPRGPVRMIKITAHKAE